MENNSKFWKLFLGSGSVSVFNAIRAFVVNKLLAVFLGPSAYACVGQFLNMMTLGQAMSSLAMQNGWVSLSAQNKDSTEQLLGIWRGGYRLTVYATVVTCVAAVLFCFFGPLESLLPGVPPRLAQAAILFALPGIVATNIITISSSVMNGLGQYRRWATINIVSSMWQMLWVAYFLFTGHLSVLSIIATQSVLAGVFAAILASRAGFSFKRLKTSVLEIRAPWKSYALMGLVPMVMTPLVLTFVRSFVGSTMGWDAAGIWQGIYKISDFIATLLSASLGVIVLPKISGKQTYAEFIGVFKLVFVRIVAFSLLMVLALYFFRGIVVSVFLSSAYAGVADYMGIQLLGDFFRSAGWCLGFVLIARQATKPFLSIEIAAQLFFAVSSVVLVKFIDFNGLMVAYAAENFLTLLALVFAVRRLKWM